MATILQTFNYGSPPPKNAIKSEYRVTNGDPVHHLASEIFKAIGKLAPNERIIIFAKDAAQATIACKYKTDITFGETNRKRLNRYKTKESMVSNRKNRMAIRNCGYGSLGQHPSSENDDQSSNPI